MRLFIRLSNYFPGPRQEDETASVRRVFGFKSRKFEACPELHHREVERQNPSRHRPLEVQVLCRIRIFHVVADRAHPCRQDQAHQTNTVEKVSNAFSWACYSNRGANMKKSCQAQVNFRLGKLPRIIRSQDFWHFDTEVAGQLFS